MLASKSAKFGCQRLLGGKPDLVEAVFKCQLS
jgi:hypothetical protein